MLDRRLTLDPQVALRPEPFGVLAYHYGNRRLIFLKHPDVVRVVRGTGRSRVGRRRLAGVRRRRGPLAVVRRGAGIPRSIWSAPCTKCTRSSERQRAERRWGLGAQPPECRVSPRSLVEQLKGGLDAPICLTWELTYACNLACVHCLSSSGRRDPRELSTAEAKAVLDELQRLQVFYINIGGGEPIDPARLLRARRLRRRPRHRRQVLDQRHVSRRGGGAPAGGDGLPRRADQPRRRRRADERPRARRRVVRRRAAGHGPPRRCRVRTVQDLRRRHAPQRRPARRVQGAGRLLRRPAAGHSPAPVRPRRRLVARAAPDERPAAPDLPLAARPRRRRADRRLVLPPDRAGRAAARV